MKQLVIDVNSTILYLLLAAQVIGGFIILGTAQDVLAEGVWIGLGFLIWCLIRGLWFVLVAILDELKKLNRKGK